jgi:uncharacterized protein (DUF1499 family)
MNFKKLGILFRESKIDDKVIYFLDDFLLTFIDGSEFSFTHLQNALNKSIQQTNKIITDLIRNKIIIKSAAFLCEKCQTSLIIKNNEAECENCHIVYDISDNSNKYFAIAADLQHHSVQYDIKTKLAYKKQKLKYFQKIQKKRKKLVAVIFDLTGSSILQKELLHISNEITRFLNEEFFML